MLLNSFYLAVVFVILLFPYSCTEMTIEEYTASVENIVHEVSAWSEYAIPSLFE